MCNARRLVNPTDCKLIHSCGYRTVFLAILWGVAILGLPITTIYEGVVTQSDRDFRLGWFHMVAPAIACIIPASFATSWPRKIGLIIATPILCGLAEIVTVAIDMMFFSGLSGIQ